MLTNLRLLAAGITCHILISVYLAIVIFIGHGSDPDDATQMPPSNDKATGRLVFFNQVMVGSGQDATTETEKRYDDLSDFCPTSGKTLLICQACYSGNVIEKAVKS